MKELKLPEDYEFGIINDSLYAIKKVALEDAYRLLNEDNTWERADDSLLEMENKLSKNPDSLLICKI